MSTKFQANILRHQVVNWLQTVAFLGILLVLVALMLHTMLGGWAAFVGVGLVLVYLTRSTVSPLWTLRALGAQSMSPWQYPELHQMVDTLAKRAGVQGSVRLHLIPTYAMNAFSTGSKRTPHLAVSVGLLQALSPRELQGVLAHEMAHIAHGDLTIMAVSQYVGRLMSFLSFLGQILLLLNLPLVLFGFVTIPFWVLLLVSLGPTLVLLLQLKLSRVREFNADAVAVGLTHDPQGLISALLRIDGQYDSLAQPWFPRVARERLPEWLQTHPATIKRVARLDSIREGATPRGLRIFPITLF